MPIPTSGDETSAFGYGYFSTPFGGFAEPPLPPPPPVIPLWADETPAVTTWVDE